MGEHGTSRWLQERKQPNEAKLQPIQMTSTTAMPAHSKKAAEAAEIVRQYMFGSIATQMMPSLPLLEHAVQSEVRLQLVQALAKLYEVGFPGKRVRSLLDELIGIGPAGMAMKLLKKVVTPTGNGEDFSQEAKAFLGESFSGGAQELASNLIKTVVPGARLVLDIGELIEPLATLYATGQVFISHFESGGTIEDFDISLVKEQFEREIQIGHKIVEIKFMNMRQ